MHGRPHLMHVFPTFVPGGIELRTVQLIDAFGDRFRHSIVALDGQTSAAARLSPRYARVLDAPPKRGTPRTTAALCGLLRRERPDLVLTYNWGAFDMLLAARLVGMSALVHHEDGFNADEATAFKRRRILARRLILARAFRVVVPSQRLRQIATDVWRLPESQVRVLPNGVAMPGWYRDPGLVRRRLGIPAAANVIGTVGCLRAEKNLGRAIEMLALLVPRTDAHLIIVGDGPERERLEAQAAARDLMPRVHFTGYQREVQPYLRAMDLFVMSSDTEQMPISLLEAMALGLPVTATNVGDISLMLPARQREFLVPSDDAAAGALSQRAAALLGNATLLSELGALNRRHVAAHYSLARAADRYLTTYLEALGGGADRIGLAS